MSIAAAIHEWAHRNFVFNRRRDRLVAALDAMLPAECSVLDIGCGNGEVGAQIATKQREVYGVETLRRDSCAIPSRVYDGSTLPFADRAFDWAVIVDVLHHVADPDRVIGEARRVTRRGVIVKDHYAETAFQRLRLAAMDWVGNRQFGVGRDGHYLSRSEWERLWARQGLALTRLDETLDLYPAPVKPLFEHGLHFVARLEH
jgi:SAM-dependent methyltransferase